MPDSIFSTYRTGENRVTASILAVLRSLALHRIERLLGALRSKDIGSSFMASPLAVARRLRERAKTRGCSKRLAHEVIPRSPKKLGYVLRNSVLRSAGFLTSGFQRGWMRTLATCASQPAREPVKTWSQPGIGQWKTGSGGRCGGRGAPTSLGLMSGRGASCRDRRGLRRGLLVLIT